MRVLTNKSINKLTIYTFIFINIYFNLVKMAFNPYAMRDNAVTFGVADLTAKPEMNTKIIIIVMTIIIFTTITAIYDIIRIYIHNYYTRIAYRNKIPRDDDNTETSNQVDLSSSITFALICFIILGLFLFMFYNKIFK